MSILDDFFCFFGPKPNKENLEVAGISVKKGLKVALSGVKNIDLEKETQWKFLKFIIITTKNLKKERISKIIYKTDCLENVENKNLTLEGKITIFKAFAFLKLYILPQ